ncbi:YlcG family protein [Klebsiella pneumoniae]|nr:YlcG family protein [Klebsiella pneumoniae]
MSREMLDLIRDHWWKLRLLRCRGTVMIDYRILKNFVRIYHSLGEKA